MSLTILAKVKTILEKIGKNGTSVSEPTVPKELKGKNKETSDFIEHHRILHEYMLYDYAASYITKARKGYLGQVNAIFREKLKAEPGSPATLRFDNLLLTKSVKNPSRLLKAELLADNLRKKGWKQTDIDQLIEDSKADSEAPVTWTVTSI